MDYKKIVENNKKYHYFIVSSNKIIYLSNSNNKSDAKKLALEKLKPKIEKFIDKNLLLLRIKSVSNKFEKQKNIKNSLKLIGGPIVFNIESGIIKNTNKIKNTLEYGSSSVYLSDKYIKKNIDNLMIDIKKIIKNHYKNLFIKNPLEVIIL